MVYLRLFSRYLFSGLLSRYEFVCASDGTHRLTDVIDRISVHNADDHSLLCNSHWLTDMVVNGAVNYHASTATVGISLIVSGMTEPNSW